MVDYPPPIVSLKHVSLQIGGKPLLDDVSLDIRRGERVVVLGANGAGKSTLLKLCGGVYAPTSGVVHAPSFYDRAFIFQHPAILRRSVLENVQFVLKNRGIREPECSARAMAALEATSLAPYAKQQAKTLSGGEQQRLALARAWVCEPKLLVADESTVSLSPGATREIEQTLSDLQVAGATLIFSTHNLAQAKRLASRIVFLHQGRVVEDRLAADFFSAAQSAAARHYIEGETV